MDSLSGLSAEQVLENFLSAPDGAPAEAALTALLQDHVREPIRSYFSSRVTTNSDQSNYQFTRFDAEDLSSQAIIELTTAIRQRREVPSLAPISNLRAFTNAICRAVYSDFWRHRFKEYSRLKNRLRYLLRSRPNEFQTDRNESNALVCFLPDSPSYRSHFSIAEIGEQVRDALPAFPVADEMMLMLETLRAAQGRLLFNDALEVIARLRGVKDIPPAEIIVPDADIESNAGDSSDNSRHANRYELAFLWKEIRELPRFQRLSLIYNLRDERGQELNCVWFETGVATLEQLAELFECDDEAMAVLLTELPYSDKEIARVLGIEEIMIDGRSVKPDIKVANLRKVARENLLRRRDGKEKRKR